MKKFLILIGFLAIVTTTQAASTGSTSIPSDAEAVTVGGAEYWKVEDMLFKRDMFFKQTTLSRIQRGGTALY